MGKQLFFRAAMAGLGNQAWAVMVRLGLKTKYVPNLGMMQR